MNETISTMIARPESLTPVGGIIAVAMRNAYIGFDAQEILREIAPALKIVAQGSLHRKYTLLAFLGLDVRGHFCIS